jgi:tetratricopeptide (TPR) repeat protein
MKKPNSLALFLSAIAVLSSILACSTGYNKHADQYFEEGLLFYERMEYDRSIESFDKTLELAPYGKDNHIVYYNRGMAHLKNRHYDEAIYDFTKSIEMTPAHKQKLQYDSLINRGEAYHKSNQLELALKDYNRAIELQPKEKNIKYIYNNRAWVHYARGNYDDANADFSEAIKIDSEFDSAFYGRATVWQKKMDYERALIDAKEAVRLQPAEKKYDDLLYEIRSAMSQ